MEYKVKKKRAVKAEQLPPQGTVELYKNSMHRFKMKKQKQPGRNCVICGNEAIFMVYFQVYKAQIMEKYCSVCLDKCVVTAPSISK